MELLPFLLVNPGVGLHVQRLKVSVSTIHDKMVMLVFINIDVNIEMNDFLRMPVRTTRIFS